jgi:hypothetical protein
MNPKAVIRGKQEQEIDTYDFQYKNMEATMVVVDGTVKNISLSLEAAEKLGRKSVLRTVSDMTLPEAKDLYLVLRSMLNVLGDLDELDTCIL